MSSANFCSPKNGFLAIEKCKTIGYNSRVAEYILGDYV
jgi:hypothetical protein